MLRPPDIAVKDYPVATKPLLGFEQQLYVSLEPFTDLGTLNLDAVNSGTYTANTANNALLGQTPQKLLLSCETVGVIGQDAMIVQVLGTDEAGQPLSGVATFEPPAYAQSQAYDVGQRRSVEVVPWQGGNQDDTKKFKTVQSVIPLQADAGYLYSNWKLCGFPDISSFTRIGTKMSLELDPKIQEPVAIQDGSDRGAYIKSGEIPVGNCNITTKDPVSADGLRRYNGTPVTGLIKEMKGERLATVHVYLGGLIMTAKTQGAEGQDPVTLPANSMYQTCGIIFAH